MKQKKSTNKGSRVPKECIDAAIAALKDFVSASAKIKPYVEFTTANEMGHPDDIAALRAWLTAYEHLADGRG